MSFISHCVSYTKYFAHVLAVVCYVFVCWLWLCSCVYRAICVFGIYTCTRPFIFHITNNYFGVDYLIKLTRTRLTKAFSSTLWHDVMWFNQSLAIFKIDENNIDIMIHVYLFISSMKFHSLFPCHVLLLLLLHLNDDCKFI